RPKQSEKRKDAPSSSSLPLMHFKSFYMGSAIVGDGDDTIQGDILALDISDKYEDLPKKTLKLFDWVLKYTDFQYVYKIDDDCYLSVDQFIDSLTYRKHFYYGRVIQRGVGSMDRAWHQLKSHTEYARKTIDKSPEPSTYADGGGGYVLSRLAMVKLQEAAQSEKGQRLIACSLMEDKLVGDLLAINDILPNNEDYESYQRRRTFSEAIPVGMWENTFFPTMDTPIVMAHMDTDRDHVFVRELRDIGGLWPKRVWPTSCGILINAKWTPEGTIGANQLELLSTSMRLQSIVSEPFAVVGVVRNEMLMLPHFLNHYRRLGVRAFFLVDNVSDDGTREYLLEQPDVALFSTDTEYRYSHYGVAWQQAILGNFCMGKWVLLADADELLIYINCENTSIEDYLTVLEADNIDAVRVNMIDMYPFGDLGGADFSRQSPFDSAPWMDRKPLQAWLLGSGYYSNTMSYTSSLRHRLSPDSEPVAFTSQKYALLRYRPWMRVSRGLHYAQGLLNVAKMPVWFAHFKYHAGFKAKVKMEVRRNQHFDNAKEYRRYLEILAESKGLFGDEGISQCYESSGSFTNLEF
ncbi:glycosyltransferase family 2 protein, partial [Nitrosomonas sp. Nm33]|uniref:glycosyltransferase family 2 protein n=1 Tax=Nitrosomonas sp. Nm33 TaxID=133724 RepID=UPI000898ADD9